MKTIKLQIKNLTKSYNKKSDILALDNVSFDVYEGEFLSILGPSGCGKTTLLRILIGLLDSTSGSILLDGKDITNLHPSKRSMGIVFQNYALFENMTVNIDEYVYFKFEGKKMPIDPSVLKMPEISEEHIVYEDGKYVLDNEFLYDSLVATVDAVIDELKNNGEELPEDFEEQYDEIKKEGRKVLDAIDFEMYFLAKLEKVQGMGMSLTVDANNVADALDIDKSELGDMNYLSLFYETSDKGVDLKLEYQEYGQDMNYLKLDCDYIYTGKKLCGFDLKYELENASKTNDESKTEDGYLYEYYKNQIESLDKQIIEIMFNTSNIERANATVFDFKADIKSNSKNYYEYGNEGGVVDTNSTNTESQTVWNIIAKTEKANQLSFNMDMSVNETVTDNGNKTKNNTQIAIDGTIEIITENIKLPEINEKVKSAIDKAIKNPQKLFED